MRISMRRSSREAKATSDRESERQPDSASESYLDRVTREGPLPKVEDDSELIGEDAKKGDKRGEKEDGVKREHGADFVTVPARGAGAFPVRSPEPESTRPDPDADPEQRER